MSLLPKEGQHGAESTAIGDGFLFKKKKSPTTGLRPETTGGLPLKSNNKWSFSLPHPNQKLTLAGIA